MFWTTPFKYSSESDFNTIWIWLNILGPESMLLPIIRFQSAEQVQPVHFWLMSLLLEVTYSHTDPRAWRVSETKWDNLFCRRGVACMTHNQHNTWHNQRHCRSLTTPYEKKKTSPCPVVAPRGVVMYTTSLNTWAEKRDGSDHHMCTRPKCHCTMFPLCGGVRLVWTWP